MHQKHPKVLNTTYQYAGIGSILRSCLPTLARDAAIAAAPPFKHTVIYYMLL